MFISIVLIIFCVKRQKLSMFSDIFRGVVVHHLFATIFGRFGFETYNFYNSLTIVWFRTKQDAWNFFRSCAYRNGLTKLHSIIIKYII